MPAVWQIFWKFMQNPIDPPTNVWLLRGGEATYIRVVMISQVTASELLRSEDFALRFFYIIFFHRRSKKSTTGLILSMPLVQICTKFLC